MRRLVWLVTGVAVLALGGVVLYLVAQSVVTEKSEQAERTEHAQGRSPASYFKEGDCIEAVPKSDQNVTIVDCEKPHAAEVIAVFMLPDGGFPGQAAIEELKRRCEPELATYAPAAADDPSVRVLKRFPDEASWNIGDRSVTCIAAFDTPRTGSLAG
jgi:hypothetical protein